MSSQKHDCLHLFTLWCLAAAVPLLSILSQNADFLVAHRLESLAIFLLAVLLLTAVPSVLCLVYFATGGRAQPLLVAVLSTLIWMPLFKKLPAPPPLLIITPTVLGVLTAVAYKRWNLVRQFASALSIALIAVPLNFLFFSPVSSLLSLQQHIEPYPAVHATAPVAVVIFDEFPITSLLDEHRRIDPVRYPNFAALAQQATWYDNATTVADLTVNAVPALLTGKYPRPNQLPILLHHPRNLFTLLGGAYDMQVYESVTSLCPTKTRPSVPTDRWRILAWDLCTVYLQFLLPRSLTMDLPDLTADASNVGLARVVTESYVPHNFMGRGQTFRTFTEHMRVTARPPLFFIHLVMPHIPWNHLPHNKWYANLDAPLLYGRLPSQRWVEDKWAVARAYQRHLLQVQFTDELLGDLVKRLHELGIYDDCLLVVVADHGVSFRAGQPRRLLVAENSADILPIPLLVKMPHQQQGKIDDRNVQSVDVLPSIADAIGIRVPWPMDGRSFVNEGFVPLHRKMAFDRNENGYLFAPTVDGKWETLERKISLFGSGHDDRIYRFGPHSEIIGKKTADLSLDRESTDGVFILENAPDYEKVDPNKDYTPCWIRGTLTKHAAEPSDLAVAINGRIWGVTSSFVNENAESKMAVLVDPLSFKAGHNDINVFEVRTVHNALRLTPLPNARPLTSR